MILQMKRNQLKNCTTFLECCGNNLFVRIIVAFKMLQKSFDAK